MPLLLVAFVFLVLVLIPGLGHEVNGSRRWLRAGVDELPGVRAGACAAAHHICAATSCGGRAS